MQGSGWSRGAGWALLLLAGVASAQPVRLYSTTHAAMGTEWRLELYCGSAARAAEIAGEVYEEVDRLDGLLSNYKETSELQRINREAGAGPVTTDGETMEFLKDAEHWSAVSGGAFDMTVGRLMKVWGFYRHQGRVPGDAELEGLRAETGWEKVRLDAGTRTVRFTTTGVELDPGGIGKGFAVDAAVRVLRADGVRAAMISAGGSTIYGLGAPPGQRGWRVTLVGPLPARETLSVVMLRDTSLSSADCSQKNFTAGGHVYCHIMDPRTMRPVEGRVQVSVVDRSATASDALSNVVFVESAEESVRTLRRYAPGARSLIVSGGTGGQPRCTGYHWGAHIEGGRCTVERR